MQLDDDRVAMAPAQSNITIDCDIDINRDYWVVSQRYLRYTLLSQSWKQSVRVMVTVWTDPTTIGIGSVLDGVTLCDQDRVPVNIPGGAVETRIYKVCFARPRTRFLQGMENEERGRHGR